MEPASAPEQEPNKSPPGGAELDSLRPPGDLDARVAALAPGLALTPAERPVAETILFASAHPRQDLAVIRIAREKGVTLTPEALSTYYAAGHRYIYDATAVSPELESRLTPAQRRLAAIYSRFARLEDPPPLAEQREIVRGITAANPKDSAIWEALVTIHLAMRGQDALAELESLSRARTETKLDRDSWCELVETLASYEDPRELATAVRLARDIIREDPLLLDFYLGNFADRDFAALEKALYSQELVENRVDEKPIDEVRRAFLTKEYVHSEIPPADALDRAVLLYLDIASREAELEALSPEELRARVEGFRQALEREGEAASRDSRLEFFAAAREVFRREYRVRPYNTQIIALLLMTDPELTAGEASGVRGIYEQVKTGEGKSLMIALLAAYRGALGEPVDVVTSDRGLAARDALRFKSFYDWFGLTCQSYEYDPREPPLTHPAQILYTTNASLIFTLLDARLEGTTYLAGRPQRTVVIDEADNLLLDLGSEGCRRSVRIDTIFDEHALRLMLAFADSPLGEQAISRSAGFAAERFLGAHPEYASADRDLLETYLVSALASRQRRRDVDFVIDDRNRVQIYDLDNGRMKKGMRWGQGLHEFVSLRHGAKLGHANALAAEMRHPEFLLRYARLFCISGTFGDETDRLEIRRSFGLRGWDVPPHHPSIRVDHPVEVFLDRAAWLARIRECDDELITPGSARSVLFIGGTVEKTAFVHRELVREGRFAQLLNDKTNVDSEGRPAAEETLVVNAGRARQRSVGSGLVGRGADIIPDAECLAAGGLESVSLDIPKSRRTELQWRGRAGRQGRPGTSRIIACLEDDLYLSTVQEFSREFLDSIARHPAFGPASDEFRRCVDFSRYGCGLVRAAEREVRHARNLVSNQVQDYYFDALAAFLDELEAKVPELGKRTARESAELGNPFLDFAHQRWAPVLDRFDRELTRIFSATPEATGGREIDPEFERCLAAEFERIFGFPPGTPAENAPVDRLFAATLRYEYRSWSEELTAAQLRAAIADSDPVRGAVREAREKVDQVMAALRERLLSHQAAPAPRPGAPGDRRARAPQDSEQRIRYSLHEDTGE